MFSMLLSFFLLFAVIIYSIFFVSQFYNVIVNKNAPLVTTRKAVTNKIINEINLTPGQTVYELGCGRAVFLQAVEKVSFRAKLIGVENLFLVYFLTKVFLKLCGSKVKMIKNDIFDINLKEADIIYCYLNDTTMEKLGTKIVQECNVGTQIISQRFPILQFKPEKIIKIGNRKVFFYVI